MFATSKVACVTVVEAVYRAHFVEPAMQPRHMAERQSSTQPCPSPPCAVGWPAGHIKLHRCERRWGNPGTPPPQWPRHHVATTSSMPWYVTVTMWWEQQQVPYIVPKLVGVTIRSHMPPIRLTNPCRQPIDAAATRKQRLLVSRLPRPCRARTHARTSQQGQRPTTLTLTSSGEAATAT